jgi:hypothetical protein
MSRAQNEYVPALVEYVPALVEHVTALGEHLFALDEHVFALDEYVTMVSPHNGSDHRAGTEILQAEKGTRKSGFVCIALLCHVDCGQCEKV